jgi:type I restriction enzyme S subunit
MVGERVEMPLGEICQVKQGKYLAPGQMSELRTPETPIPVYGAGGILGYTDQVMFDEPVALVTCRGSNCGMLQRTEGRAWVSNNAMACPPKSPNKNRFVYYLLLASKFSDVTTGSAQPQITATHLNAKLLSIATDPNEQQAIASVLGALDDKIELNRRMNETLEALAQSLFKAWFVDATQAGLPKGWRYATIAELCEINSWTLGKGDELDRIEYVEISEVMRGNIANIQSYERGEEPSRARRRLRHGDTVLSTVRPDRGAYFLCLNPSPNLIGSTGFAVLTPTKAPWSFIHAAVTQPDVFEYLGQQADGGAYPAVRPEIIGGLEVPWPNKPELVEDFHRACAPLYERTELNRRQSRTLAALRDALLPKLLSGELRVPAAEKELASHA